MTAAQASKPPAAGDRQPVGADIEFWLRYTHLDKIYGYLPGIAATIPAIFGLDRAAYEQVRARFAAQVAAATERLLGDAHVAGLVDALPFRPGQRVLAVGDSLTDDLLSWAEILRQLLFVRRRADRIEVVNAGLSGFTTAMVLRRWPATLATIRPDWVLCLLGGNDVTRIGPDAAKPQVSPAESVANLAELRRIAGDVPDHRWAWLTVVPVDEERVRAHPPFRYGGSTWRNQDVVALNDGIRDRSEIVIDTAAVFSDQPDPARLEPDGVHLTLTGQTAVVTAVLEVLAAAGAGQGSVGAAIPPS